MTAAASIARQLIEDVDDAKADLLSGTSTVYILLVTSEDDGEIIIAQAFRTEYGALKWGCDWAKDRVKDFGDDPADFGLDEPSEGALDTFANHYGYGFNGLIETPLHT